MWNWNYYSIPFNSMGNINYYLRPFNAITYSVNQSYVQWKHAQLPMKILIYHWIGNLSLSLFKKPYTTSNEKILNIFA